MENQLQYDYTPLEELPNPSGVTIENEIISKSALSGLVPKVIESIKALLSSSSVPPPPSSADQSTERARYSYHFVGAEQQIAARFPHVKVNQQTKITLADPHAAYEAEKVLNILTFCTAPTVFDLYPSEFWAGILLTKSDNRL